MYVLEMWSEVWCIYRQSSCYTNIPVTIITVYQITVQLQTETEDSQDVGRN